jgi:outer membrane protein
LTGNATLTGQAIPYYLHNQDQSYEGRLVLTIPLTNGGRIGSLVARREDRNALIVSASRPRAARWSPLF